MFFPSCACCIVSFYYKLYIVFSWLFLSCCVIRARYAEISFALLCSLAIVCSLVYLFHGVETVLCPTAANQAGK